MTATDLTKANIMSMQDRTAAFLPSRAPIFKLFLYSLLLVLVFNAFHIFQFPLTIDGETAAFEPSPDNYLQNERWAACVLIYLLMPHAVIPIVPDLLASLTLAASYTLTTRDWCPEIGFRHYVAAPVALMFPLFAEVVLFPDISYALCIGLLMAAAGTVALRSRTVVGYAGGLAAITFAVGIYQPIALYPVAVLAVATALDLQRRRVPEVLAGAVAALCAVVLAVVLSKVIGHALVKWYGLSSGYLDSSTNLGMLIHQPREVLHQTASTARRILSGTYLPLYLEDCRIFPVILALSAVGLVAVGAWRVRPGQTALATLLLLLNVLAMAGVVVINDGSLPNRTLLGLPIAAAGLVFVGSGVTSRALRVAFVCCSAFCTLAFATIGSRTYFAAYVTWLNDRALGQQMVERIETLPDLPTQRPLPLEIVGFHEWPSSPMTPVLEGSMVGSSFFYWDQGSAGRIIDFLRSVGVREAEFVPASREQHLAVMQEATAMPAWPRPGSVKLVGGTVVVKFSAYSDPQL